MRWSTQEAVGCPKILKIHCLLLFFYFFVNFHPLFWILRFCFTYLYLSENFKIFCGLFLHQLEIYQIVTCSIFHIFMYKYFNIVVVHIFHIFYIFSKLDSDLIS